MNGYQSPEAGLGRRTAYAVAMRPEERERIRALEAAAFPSLGRTHSRGRGARAVYSRLRDSLAVFPAYGLLIAVALLVMASLG